MNKTLKIIREELDWLVNDYKATTKFSKDQYISTLSYQMSYDRRKIKTIFQFLFMTNENALSLRLIYQFKDRHKGIEEVTYPFSKVPGNAPLPMINDFDYKRIQSVLKFEEQEGMLKSTVLPTVQALTYTEIIRRNIKEIMDFGAKLKVEEKEVVTE